LKACELELGGADPMVFFQDSNLEESVKMLVNSKLANNGQVCISPKRIFVHAVIYEEFKKLLMEEIDKIRGAEKYLDGIKYGADSIEETLKKQILEWKNEGRFDGRVIRGSKTAELTQEISVFEVQGKVYTLKYDFFYFSSIFTHLNIPNISFNINIIKINPISITIIFP
jgi:acyl-CoA reductase-like NAD-dependent aldehyde dehydrogenase